MELEAGWRSDLVRVRWNGTYLEAEDRVRGRDLLRRPRESANLVLTISPSNWRLNLTSRYVGRRDDIDPVTFVRSEVGGFVRLDLAVERRMTSWLTPYARIENLLDREHEEVLGFPAPRMTLVGGLAFGF